MAEDKTNFFKLDRRIFDSDIWTQPVELRIFIYLIGQARFSEKPNKKYKSKGVIIKQGQYLKSYRSLQKELEYLENNQVKQYPLSRIKRAIDKLKQQNRIKTKTTQLGTLFTIVNYCHYQGEYNNKGGTWNADGTQVEQHRNNTNKGVRREKKDKGDKFSITKKENGRYDYPDDYEKLYSLYPDNKGSKKAGWRKWAATRRKGVPQEELMKAVKNYARECKREQRNKTYVKHISTFLGPDEHWQEYLVVNDNKIDYEEKRRELLEKQRKFAGEG